MNDKKKNNLLMEARTELIQSEFKWIIEGLICELFDDKFNATEYEYAKLKEEEAMLKGIALLFENQPNAGYEACAFLNWKYSEKEKKKVIDESFVKYNVSTAYNARRLLIHEIAHVIVRYYGWVQNKKHNGSHCLEFAMISYCILWKLFGQTAGHDKCYLESYDIHEDIAYPLLCISPSRFDAIIRSIQWNSLEQLANTVEKLAEDIRRKSISSEPKTDHKKEIKSIKIVLHDLYSVIKYNFFQLLPNRNKP